MVTNTRHVRAAEAARVLGISPSMVNKLAREGRLPRVIVRRQAWFPAEAVRSLARFRKSSRVTLPDELRDLIPRDRRSNGIWLRPDTLLVNTKEAAHILGITPAAVTNLARRGRIACIQQRPFQSGSPLYFSRCILHAMLNGEDYQIRRRRRAASGETTSAIRHGLLERHDPAKEHPGLSPENCAICTGLGIHQRLESPETEPVPWREEKGIPNPPPLNPTGLLPPDRSLLTTRQVAEALGVTRGRIYAMVRQGRLTPVHRKRRQFRNRRTQKKDCRYGNLWHFFPREQIVALMSDPSYQDHSSRQKRPPVGESWWRG